MKINKFWIILFLILPFLGSCNQVVTVNPDNEIYSKIISGFKAKDIVVVKYTRPVLIDNPDFSSWSERLPGLQKDTYDDFVEKYKQTDTLENGFDTRKKVILISPDEDIKQIILTKKEFLGKDINEIKIQGTTIFSRVGYNKSNNQAIVCDWTQSGFLSGSGYVSLFEKRNNKWKLKSNFLIGIS